LKIASWHKELCGKLRAVDPNALERGPKQVGASVNIAGLDEGHYGIEFWDTKSGKVIGTDSQSVRPLRHFGYGIQLQLPEFQGDIAVRIIRRGESWTEK
jgi:hypothetical protein